MPAVTHLEIERVFREQYGRAVAVLVRVFGDIDIAEEAVQDAFTTAVARWPSGGVPPAPAGWIITHGPQSCDRPPATRVLARRPPRPGDAAVRSRRARGGEPGEG